MKKRILKNIRSGLMLSVVATTALTFVQNVSAKDITQDYTLASNETENIVVKSGSNITIDLNGHDLTTTNQDAITVELGATVTIKGSGTVEAIGKGYASLYNNGTTTINGGTFKKDEEKGAYYSILNHGILTINDATVKLVNFTTSSLIDNGYYNYNKAEPKSGYVSGTNMAEPTLTINGGTFDGGLNTVKNDDGAVLTINDGHFVNNIQFAVMNWNDTTINGGIFEVPTGNEKTTLFNGTYGADSVDKGLLKVNNGTFEAEYLLAGNTFNKVEINGGLIKTSKGIISSTKGDGTGAKLDTTNVSIKNATSILKPEAGLIAEGYTAYFAENAYVIDKKGSFTSVDEVIVKVGETKDLEINADENAQKYLAISSDNKDIATISGTSVKGITSGTTSVVIDLKDGTTKTVNVIVYDVKSSDEETKSEENNVKDSISNILDGKKVDGIDDETSNNVVDAVKNGSVIKTEIETKEISEDDLTDETKKEISTVIENGEVVLKYYDINFLLKANNSVLGRLSTLKAKVSISLNLPEDIAKVEDGYTRKYFVIRVHDGKAEKIEAKLEDGKVTFETDKFSNYTLTYVDTKNDDDKQLDDVPKTSDTGKAIILVVSTLTYALGIKTLKRY